MILLLMLYDVMKDISVLVFIDKGIYRVNKNLFFWLDILKSLKGLLRRFSD